MAILEKKKTKIEIDLKSSSGNAFVLIGLARQYGKQLNFDNTKIDVIVKEMTSGNYENLITVFDRNFGEYIVLIR